MIVINRTKAEQATRDRLRLNRAPRLEALDVAYMRALEQGADTAAIVTEKQALRDVTAKALDGLSIAHLATITLEEALSL
jgi:hypothetical protein